MTGIVVYTSFIIVFGTVGNLFLLSIYFKNKSINRKPFNLLLCNLFICDIIAALHLIPFAISYAEDRWMFGFVGCQVIGLISYLVLAVSVLNLFSISLNRYIKICRSYRGYLINARNVKINLFMIWFIPSIDAALQFFSKNWFSSDIIPSLPWCAPSFKLNPELVLGLGLFKFVLPVAVSIFCFASILRFLRAQLRSLMISQATRAQRTTNRRDMARAKKYFKSNSLLVAMGLCFVFLYTPIFVVFSLHVTEGADTPDSKYISACLSVTMLNHVCNPVIYGLFNSNFRSKIDVLFGGDRQ